MAANPKLFSEEVKPRPVFEPVTYEEFSNNFAFNQAQQDAVITGDPTLLEKHYESYKIDDTVRSDTLEMFAQMYNDEVLVNTGVLDDLHNYSVDEQIERVMHEVDRIDANKLAPRQALTIQMFRAGLADQPTALRDEVFMEIDSTTLEGLQRQYAEAQRTRLQRELDAIVAPMGTDFTTLNGTLQAVQSEFIPFFSIATRVAATRTFKPKDGDDMASYWPGEIRQDIREWFSNATAEERISYVRELGEEVEKLRKGKYSALFTDYLIIEQFMGIFSEELLGENTPKSTWDRVIGNLDLLLETVYGVGLVAKFGARSTKAVFKANNASAVRQAAKVSGNKESLEKLDDNLRRVADRLEVTPQELAAGDLPKPASMRDQMEVLPDSVKGDVQQVLDTADQARARVLINTDSLTGVGLNDLDKASAVAAEIRAIDNADNVHLNYRMMNLEDLPNDVGVRITAVLGRTPGSGWDDFGDLVDDLVDLDPNLEAFEIVKRNKLGELEKVDITPEEIAKFVVNGEVPASIEQGLWPGSASTRLFQGKRLSQASDSDLRWWVDNVDPNSDDYLNITAEIDRRAVQGPPDDTLRMLDGDEFYIRTTQDRYWHQGDKDFLGPETFQNTGILPEGWVAPNARFGPDIVNSFTDAYLVEQAGIGKFNEIYKPFYNLSTKDKRVVENVFEWAEDFAKLRAESGSPRAPTFSEIMANFDGLTPAQIKGYVAIKEGMNLQWELFNRRLYRDFSVRGLQTARSTDPKLPRYHGVPVKRETINRSNGVFLDPVKNEAVTLSKAEIDDVYNAGGSVIKLDFPITAGKGGRVDRVLVKSGEYELGTLSRRPLEYHEGYYMRFYDDPYMIIKKTKDPTINGVTRAGEELEEAIRTAGTAAEGNRFIRNLLKDTKNARANVTYETKRVKDISNVEGTLFQEEALYREGRLFWDARNYERLPDVNGNRAQVNDLVRSLEKGTAMAMRQNTHEDLFATLRGAFGKEYSDLLSARVLANDDIKVVIRKLKDERMRTADPTKKARINEALKLAKYFRVQLGTDSLTIPMMREFLINKAAWVGEMGITAKSPKLSNALLRSSRAMETYFQSFDPYRTMRSIAFNVFMVFRPVRQLVLQSMQVSYLSPLDPTYVATGRIFKDALALRRGLHRLRKAGYQDGIKDKVWAETMGLSKKEYDRLVEEFDRTGLLESVNVHTHSGGALRAKRLPLPKETALSRSGYKARQAGRTTQEFLQKGFDIGEQNNLTFSYLIALRRMMKNKKVKSLTELSRKDFDALKIDASNLALGMIRPNKFAYQSGYMGVFTQFLSFSHKAALGVLGKNPAISKPEALKIMLGTYMLYGANMFGAEEGMREWLSSMGLGRKADEEVADGITLIDVLSAGVIEAGFNELAKATNEEWKDLDLGFLAPGVNTLQIYEKVFENVLDQPEKVVLGPFYNPASGFLKGLEFTNQLLKADPDLPAADKFVKTAELMLNNVLPGFNDANKAYIAGTMGVWKSNSGDVLPLQPTWNTILARGALGVRSEEELALYRIRNKVWEHQDNINNAVETTQNYLSNLRDGWYAGDYSDEYIYDKVRSVSNLFEHWPQGARHEILRRVMTEPDKTGESFVQSYAKLAAKGGASLNLEPWIRQAPDMTPQEKRQLLNLNNELFLGREDAEAQRLEMLQRDVESRE